MYNIFWLALEVVCSCDQFVDENGLGACQKRDETFDGAFTCFVGVLTGCRDVNNSTTNPGKQLSAVACEHKNKGNISLQVIENASYFV